MIVNPLLILNLGYISGLRPREITVCAACSCLAALCGVGGAASPVSVVRLTCIGVQACLTLALSRMVVELPAHAWNISHSNYVRVKISGDLLVCCWAFYPALQASAVLGMLSAPTQLSLLALMDVPVKFGACHLMLKSGYALKAASEYLEASEQQREDSCIQASSYV